VTNQCRNQLLTTALLIDGVGLDPAVKSVRELGVRTRAMNSVVKFCCILPTTSDSPFCAASHFLVSGGHLGDIQPAVDYENAILIGLLAIVRRLQSVLNAVARLIYHMRSVDHITDILAYLHWLRIPGCIEYKVAAVTYKVLHGNEKCATVLGTTHSCCRSARMMDSTLW